MNAQLWFPASQVNRLNRAPSTKRFQTTRARRCVRQLRGGYHVLSELLLVNFADRVQLVGVATDDPNPSPTPKVRLWKYPHGRRRNYSCASSPCRSNCLFSPVVKSPLSFTSCCSGDWKPDLCLMATYGQKISNHIITLPRRGFLQFSPQRPDRPSSPARPDCRDAARDGLKHLVPHHAQRSDDVIDDGAFRRSLASRGNPTGHQRY